MARDTIKDARAIMTLLVKEATGQNPTTQIVDTSSFVSAGKTVLALGVEPTLNALSMINIRTAVDVRPYGAQFNLITEENISLYKARLRKISFYSKMPIDNGAWNTDQFVNHADGYDNGKNGGQSTGSMWEQNPSYPLEMFWENISSYQDSLTVYEDALKLAFADESTFMAFYSGQFAEKSNELETMKEAYARMTCINRIIGTYALGNTNAPGSVVNLTKAFNDFYSTSLTTKDLLSTHLKEFLGFMLSQIEIDSKSMASRSLNFHWSPTKTVGNDTYKVLRHTPKASQRLFLINSLMSRAKTIVQPEVFHNELLTTNFEGVDYWQNFNDKFAVKGKASIPNVADTSIEGKSDEVDLKCVIGCLFDDNAMKVAFNLDRVASTPVEARKHYVNTFWDVTKSAVNDYTQNFILYVMEDEDETVEE